jgi:ABC-type multidrug transport system fused ATPase/permease subunit
MGSFERILNNVDPKVSEGSRFHKKPENEFFGKKGVLSIKNIKCRYRDNLPLVLNGLSFSVKSKEKVAIVGRTGSGKSSLMLALTRILNVENSPFFPEIAKLQGIDNKLLEYNFPEDISNKFNNNINMENSETEIFKTQEVNLINSR